MRVLCTCLPEYGHFHAMVPLAKAVVAAGHDVAFATALEFCPRVEAAGFDTWFPAGITHERQMALAASRYPEAAARPPGAERFEAFVPLMLGGVAAPARVDDLVRAIDGWQADLVVHDEADFGAPVAAAVRALPHATHALGVLRPFAMARLAAEALAPVCRSLGVEVGPLGGLFDYLYLDVCPPSMQAPHIAEVVVSHPLRPVAFDAAPDERLPAWVEALPALPTLYVSLGTVFNHDHAAFAAVLAGVRDEPVNVVVTVGRDADPSALGPQPAHVRVERYIPQSLLLPYCDAAVTQAGWSTFPMLARGLPLLLVPRGANQFHTAEAAARAGVARRLLPHELAPEAVRREVRRLLADPVLREAAGRVSREIEAMPGPEDAVGVLERLARERVPLVAADRPPR